MSIEAGQKGQTTLTQPIGPTLQRPPRLQILKDENGLFWTLSIEGKETTTVRIETRGAHDRFYIWRALIHSAHSIFFDLFPVPTIEIQIGSEIAADPAVAIPVQDFVGILRGTNRFLNEFLPQFKIAESYQNVFFYSPEDHPHLRAIYEATKAKGKCEAFYDTCSTGWNPVDRTWERPLFMPIRELLKNLIEKKVKRFVTLNHYFVSYHQLQGVFILPLFQKLGIEYICYYGDTVEGISPIEVAALDCESFRNYHIASHLTRDWHQIFQKPNVRPHSTGYFVNRAYDVNTLDSDYGIFIASNSRIQDLRINFLQLLSIFESSTTDENIYDDFQIWFMSMRRLLLNHSNLSGPVREAAGLACYQYYVNGISFLKYLTIDGLRTTRPIRIYGDKGWGQIFSNLYQNEYLSESGYQKLAADRKHMSLLMNASIFYPDANPVVHKAIDLAIPYLGFPATVRTPEFSGFRRIEYRSISELNSMIESVNRLSAEPEVLKSRRYFIDTISALLNAMVDDFSGIEPGYDLNSNPYAESTRAHLKQLDIRTSEYIQKNLLQMQNQISNIFSKGDTDFKFENSRFSHRPFMQKLKVIFGYSN